MLISDSIYTVDTSQKSQETINRLDSLLSNFIMNRHYVTKQMSKGVLDYEGMNKDRFSWRFEAKYNDEGIPVLDGEEEGNPQEKVRTACTFKTAEQFYRMEYQTVRIVRDKVDEYLNDITTRPWNLEVKSVPYTNIRHVFSHLMQRQFQNPVFQVNLKQAQKDAAVKGTGFLRLVMYDRKTKQRFVNFHPKGGLILGSDDKKRDPWIEKEVVTQAGLQIERIEPENVFVDPISKDPKEMFIISNYEASELAYRFPMLKDKKLISEFILNDIDGPREVEDKILKKTSRYNYRAGERLTELYRINDLMHDNYSRYFSPEFGKSPYGIYERGANRNLGDPFVSSPMFGRSAAQFFFDDLLSGYTPEERKYTTYQVIEYYNVNKDLYVVYIDDVVLYQGPIIEPFKDLPIVPIYFDNKIDGFYGKPLTEYFCDLQDMITEADHQQRLSMLVTGKETISVTSELIDEAYHPNKQFEIVKDNPIHTIYTKPHAIEGKFVSAVTPMALGNGSNAVLQNRKLELYSVMEKMHPSLKPLTAGNPPELQRETMYSRDAFMNAIIDMQNKKLSEFAYKVFSGVIFELKYFAPKPNMTIPPFEGADGEWGFVISNTDEETQTAKRKKNEEIEQIYVEALTNKVNEYMQQPQLVEPIMQEIDQEIAMLVLGSPEMQSLFPEGLGQTPEEQQVNMTAALSLPQVQQTIAEVKAGQGQEILRNRLLDMARQEVQRLPDTNYYLSFEKLDNLLQLRNIISFNFDKSQKEKEEAMIRFVNMIKPIEQTSNFIFDPSELGREMVIAAGMNPDVIMNPKPMAVSKMFEVQNTRTQVSIFPDKIPSVFAEYLNENLGQPKFTEDQIIDSLVKLEAGMSKVRQQEIVLRNTSKAQTSAITDTNKQQTRYELDQAAKDKEMERTMAMTANLPPDEQMA